MFTLGVKDEFSPSENFSLKESDIIDNTYDIYKSFDKLIDKWDDTFGYVEDLSYRVDSLAKEISGNADITDNHVKNEQQYLTELADKVNELYEFVSKRLDVLLDKREEARDDIERLLDVDHELTIGNDTFCGPRGGIFCEYDS